MHKWSNGQNFISSWAPWHRFRWFVLASSLALVQKKPDPWHSFFRRGGSAPAWCPISLLCFSKEFTDETRCKYPSKGPGAIRHCSPVLCGDTSSQCPSKKRHIHVAASHVRKQALYLFQSNETFCVFQKHGVFTVTAGDEVLVLPLHVSRKKLSIKTLLVGFGEPFFPPWRLHSFWQLWKQAQSGFSLRPLTWGYATLLPDHWAIL